MPDTESEINTKQIFLESKERKYYEKQFLFFLVLFWLFAPAYLLAMDSGTGGEYNKNVTATYQPRYPQFTA